MRQNRKETSQDRQLQRIKNHFQRAFFDIKQTMNSCSTSLSSLYTFPTSNLIIFSMSKLGILTCLISSSSWTLSNSISLVSTCLFSNGNKYSFYTSLYLILAISSPSRPRACSSMPQIKKSYVSQNVGLWIKRLENGGICLVRSSICFCGGTYSWNFFRHKDLSNDHTFTRKDLVNDNI